MAVLGNRPGVSSETYLKESLDRGQNIKDLRPQNEPIKLVRKDL